MLEELREGPDAVTKRTICKRLAALAALLAGIAYLDVVTGGAVMAASSATTALIVMWCP